MMLLATLMGAELHVYPSLFTAHGKPLDEKQFPGGPWFPGKELKLSNDCTGHVVFDAKQAVQLFVVCKKVVTQSLPLAGFTRLEGAYEKTTNSWLTQRDGTWELVTSTFLRDFEFEDPSVPGTKNITGQNSTVHVFKQGKFEFVSNQLPPKREFPIKK